MSGHIRFTMFVSIVSVFCAMPAFGVMFGDPVVYPLGGASVPTEVTTADFDGDGWNDVVVTESGYDRVSLFFNDGTGFGSSEAPLWIDVGDTPISVKSSDIDGDGDMDMIVANFQDSILSYVRNDGDRSFTHIPIDAGSLLSTRDIAVCDLNADTVPDVISANNPGGAGNDTVTVFLGTGGGSFSSPSSFSTGGTGASSIVCDEISGDAHLDLAIASDFSDDVSVLLGQGDGTFAAPVQYSVAAGARSLAACDVDGDGAIDIVVNAVFDDTVSLLRNNGDGTFGTFQTLGFVNGPEGIACVDVDRDGDADILGGADDDAFVLVNQGDGTFEAPAHFAIGVSDPRRVAVAYLDDDCLLDLLLIAASNELAVLRNGDLGIDFSVRYDYAVGNFSSHIIAADTNADGYDDLITVNSTDSALSLLVNNQDGTFATALEIPLACQSNATGVVAADFNNDSAVDLAAISDTPNCIAVLLNDGSGNFGPVINYPSTLNVGEGIEACDLDGDLDTDLVVADHGGGILVFLNNGDGTFAPFYPIPGGEDSPRVIVCADLNQDGDADVAIGTNSGIVYVYHGNGDGSFQQGQINIAPDTPRAFVQCDFNGDFLPDLATASDDGISILINQGSDFAEQYLVGPTGRNRLACCDIDSDGDTDLILDVQNDQMTALLNNGAGLFELASATYVMTLAGIVCADLNADAAPDVATTGAGIVNVRHNTILPVGGFVQQPEDQTVPAGSEVTFEVSVDSPESSTYQWLHNGYPIPGETDAVLTLPFVTPLNAGDYRAFADTGCFGGFSHSAALVVDAGPVVPPLPATAPHNILKNRYISLDPRGQGQLNVGKDFDIRVTLSSTLVNGVTATGSSWWANAPSGECISVVGPTRPVTPPNWDACPTLHLTGCPMIPTSTYDIVVVDGAIESSPPLVAQTQTLPTGSKWFGDCVGQFDPAADAWTPPNGIVAIDDAVAGIKTFQNPSLVGPGCGTPPCNATHVSVTDIHPAGFPLQPWGAPNNRVDINDVFGVILGFQGNEYPRPAIELCPDP